MQTDISPEEWERVPDSIKNALLALVDELSTTKRVMVQVDRTLEGVRRLSEIRQTKPNQVVFVCDTPTTRQAKLAYGLRNAGWEVVLLHRDEAIFELNRYFSVVQRYEHPSEAALYALACSPRLFHVFSSWNFDVAEVIMARRPGRIVFDNYDVFAATLQPEFSNQLQAQMQKEKFCLSRADALCSRSLTLQLVKKSGAYTLAKKKLFFPEYCWNFERPLQPKRTDGLHLVFVGDIVPGDFRDSQKLNCCDLDFIEEITRRRIHYHLYPHLGTGVSFESHLVEYLEVTKHNPYFHMHRPVHCDDLIYEISQYHFGIITCSKKVLEEGNRTYLAETHHRHMANKLFDYLDAGLPPLMCVGRLANWFMKRSGAAVVATREEFPELLDRLQEPAFVQNLTSKVADARNRYSMKQNIPRLIRLYESVAPMHRHETEIVVRQNT